MKIMVAGGAGYVGSVLVPLLVENGFDVTVFDLEWFGNHLPASVPVEKRDLMTVTRDDMKGFNAVVFLAGVSNDPMAGFSPSLNYRYNAALPAYLAYEAKLAGVKRFVYASTCSIYGYAPNELSLETSRVQCSYPYGISKLQGEVGIMQLADENFSAISLRQGTVCGLSPRMRFDLIVNTMFKCAVKDRQITIDNPATWRPIIDVRDTSAAFLGALKSVPEVSGIFNVIGGNFTVEQVAGIVRSRVEEVFNFSVALKVDSKPNIRSYRVSSEASKTIGYKAKYSIRDMVDSIAMKFGPDSKFDDPIYRNIEVFKTILK